MRRWAALSGRARAAVLIAVVAVVLGGALGARAVLVPASREVVYAIPAGTATRLAAGEKVDVLPSLITLRVNDTFVIRNDDSAVVQVGPFKVEPGQRFIHQYKNVGTYDLECSVHDDGRLRILVY